MKFRYEFFPGMVILVKRMTFFLNVFYQWIYLVLFLSMNRARLLLADGRLFEGKAFGAEGETVGEICFNTGMTGYQEILTDPSYCRQIVTMTSPHIGNYGGNSEDI